MPRSRRRSFRLGRPTRRRARDDWVLTDPPARSVCLSCRGFGANRAPRRIAPTGGPIVLKGIAIYRIEGGKLMERWVVSDLYGVLENSGALSAR